MSWSEDEAIRSTTRALGDYRPDVEPNLTVVSTHLTISTQMLDRAAPSIADMLAHPEKYRSAPSSSAVPWSLRARRWLGGQLYRLAGRVGTEMPWEGEDW